MGRWLIRADAIKEFMQKWECVVFYFLSPKNLACVLVVVE
jgi:hypothetical protein